MIRHHSSGEGEVAAHTHAHHGAMREGEVGDQAARRHVVEFIRTIHDLLPDSALSARERLDVRRDLLFLAAESQRPVFRTEVAELLSEAVWAELRPTRPSALRAARHGPSPPSS